MTDDKKPDKTVAELVEQFKTLVNQADAIRQQMKDLARQIESHTGQKTGLKSSRDFDQPQQ